MKKGIIISILVVALAIAIGVIVKVTKRTDEKKFLRYAEKGKLKKVQKHLAKLREKKLDVNFRNKKGKTALMKSADEGKLMVVKYLVKEGAKLDLQDHKGETALHKAAEEGHLDVVKFLVAAGANKNLKNKKGRTPLAEAEDEEHEEIIVFLKGGKAPVVPPRPVMPKK